MKKQLLSILTAATMLFATSCSDEELTYENASKQSVTFKVQVEGAGTGSRTIADGTNHITIGEGKKVNKLFYAVYESKEEGKEVGQECLMEGEATVNNGVATVFIPLVNGLKFDLVFLAYNDENNLFGIPRSLTFTDGLCAEVDLENLKLRTDLTANQEAHDAFYHVEPNYITNTNSTTPVTLKRMLAQLNVATTDSDLSLAKQLKADITQTAITLKGVPNQFNARSGAVTGETEVTYAVSDILKCSGKTTGQVHENEQLNVTIDGEDKSFNYLAMAYVLAGRDESSLHDTKVSFYRGEGENTELVHTRTIPTLPLQRQYRTNVTGNVLTQQEAFDISLDIEFGDKHQSVGDVVIVGDATDLQTAIDNAIDDVPVEIQLGDNINLNDLASSVLSSRATDKYSSALTIAAEKNIILDLNSFNLSYTSNVIHEGMITNYGTLTIKNGTVTYTYEGEADQSNNKGNYAINNAGTLVVDANINAVVESEIEKFPHAFYAINTSGKTTINGGKIHNEHQYAIRQWIDSEINSSDITINGGEIKGVRAIWIQLPGSEKNKEPKGNLTITDGKLTGTYQETDKDTNKNYHLAIYSYSFGNNMKNVNINISGGTFDGDIALTGGSNKENVETLTITGGTFCGNTQGVYSYATPEAVKGNVVISGGTFTETAKNGIDEALLADKCSFEKNENGTYDVVRGDYLSLGEFVKAVIEANGVYDGQNALVKIKVESGDARTSDSEFVPNRLQKYSNPEVYYAQYQRFSELTDVAISNVNFEFVPAAVTVADAWNTAGATTTAENINGELQFMNTGAVTLTNCTFKMVSVSPISAPALTVEGCSFNGLDAYAIKDVKAGTVAINNNHFTDCNGGFWFSNAPTSLIVKGNDFSQVGRRGAIQFSEAGDYTNTSMGITGNKVNDGAFLWQLNKTVTAEQIEAILDKKNNTYETAFVDGSLIVRGETAWYKTIDDAITENESNISLYSDIALTEKIYSNANFVLDGRGHTISQKEGSTNNYALFDSVTGKIGFKNVVFAGIKGGAVIRTTGAEASFDNVTVENAETTQVQGLFRLLGKNTITNCTFKKNNCNMVISLNYDGNNNDPQVVENCLFEENICSSTAVLYYVKGEKATINGNKFIKNQVKVTDGNNAATLYMGFTENNTITNNLFQENEVIAGTSKRVAGAVMLGYETVFTGNAFIGNKVTGENAKGNDVCASVYYTEIDLSGNYWGGSAPIENDDYFVEYPDNNEVIINDYLTTNPFENTENQ